MVLSQQDIEKAHDAFEKFDVDHSGCIDAWELKEAMKSLGQNPTDEEVIMLFMFVCVINGEDGVTLLGSGFGRRCVVLLKRYSGIVTVLGRGSLEIPC